MKKQHHESWTNHEFSIFKGILSKEKYTQILSFIIYSAPKSINKTDVFAELHEGIPWTLAIPAFKNKNKSLLLDTCSSIISRTNDVP